jgi:hypothetical protein
VPSPKAVYCFEVPFRGFLQSTGDPSPDVTMSVSAFLHGTPDGNYHALWLAHPLNMFLTCLSTDATAFDPRIGKFHDSVRTTEDLYVGLQELRRHDLRHYAFLAVFTIMRRTLAGSPHSK